MPLYPFRWLSMTLLVFAGYTVLEPYTQTDANGEWLVVNFRDHASSSFFTQA